MFWQSGLADWGSRFNLIVTFYEALQDGQARVSKEVGFERSGRPTGRQHFDAKSAPMKP